MRKKILLLVHMQHAAFRLFIPDGILSFADYIQTVVVRIVVVVVIMANRERF